MYDAVCDNCGNRCQIPFQPRSGRKVYCSHCFEQIEKGENGSSESPKIQEQLDAINIKLGKILQLLSAKTPMVPASEITQEATPNEKIITEEITAPEVKTLKAAAKKKTTAKKKISAKTGKNTPLPEVTVTETL
jgi:CxxC-x17-CxxC domain-containing protein